MCFSSLRIPLEDPLGALRGAVYTVLGLGLGELICLARVKGLGFPVKPSLVIPCVPHSSSL